MNKEVPAGEIAVTGDEDDLTATGIGSCVVITLYDPKHKVGALAHTLLPARRMFFEARDSEYERRKMNLGSPDTRYADTAIDEMVKRMEALGAKRENLEAKLIGGANMFAVSDPSEDSIGKKNIASAKEKLKRAGVAIVGECVGGSQGRSVEFSLANGIVTVKTKF